ncbi:MAG: hypothetical protein HXY34_07025 [Candidatus Thorarchaeota archaeon]|nr:hypothetical protein [Candidatus Thorarchaeota archaeon]
MSIADATPKRRGVCLLFRVVRVDREYRGVARSTGRRLVVRDLLVGDASGTIVFVAWNEDALEMKVGGVYSVSDVSVDVYDHCMRLRKGHQATVRELHVDIDVNMDNDMSRPFAWKPHHASSRRRSSTGRTFWGAPGREDSGYCGSRGF